MTKKQCLTKIKSMKKDMNRYIMKRAEELLNSGAVDLAAYKDFDFALPKVILHVILIDASNQYRPLTENLRKEVKNLKHF